MKFSVFILRWPQNAVGLVRILTIAHKFFSNWEYRMIFGIFVNFVERWQTKITPDETKFSTVKITLLAGYILK